MFSVLQALVEGLGYLSPLTLSAIELNYVININ